MLYTDCFLYRMKNVGENEVEWTEKAEIRRADWQEHPGAREANKGMLTYSRFPKKGTVHNSGFLWTLISTSAVPRRKALEHANTRFCTLWGCGMLCCTCSNLLFAWGCLNPLTTTCTTDVSLQQIQGPLSKCIQAYLGVYTSINGLDTIPFSQLNNQYCISRSCPI